MHVDAENVAIHGERIADATFSIQRIARRQRMQHGAVVAHRLLACGGQYALEIARFHFLAAEIDGGGIDVAGDAAGGDVDDQAVDGKPRHALGRIDGKPHDALDRFQIGDDAGLDAAGALMPDPDHLDMMGAVGKDFAFFARRQPADHANDFGRADVEHRNDMRPLG